MVVGNGGNPASIARRGFAARCATKSVFLHGQDPQRRPFPRRAPLRVRRIARHVLGAFGEFATFVEAAAARMRERWDDVAELERMARDGG